ncbi:hypothetical protein RHMOL_Rhmol01G0311700 [Rhododendron molle]|uniref:Uncharacterized protein n=1 Tax=Rhododendron molle TaxID=49168 RepID=A0ACC0Q905_RHOML|nr:hypothetical protein RHMOL_Rhmol01G0311700 [Rhododendron molle]
MTTVISENNSTPSPLEIPGPRGVTINFQRTSPRRDPMGRRLSFDDALQNPAKTCLISSPLFMIKGVSLSPDLYDRCSGSGVDIGNNSHGNHQLVVGAQQWGTDKISSPAVKVRKYTKFSPEENKKLILGVQKCGKSWKSIKLHYFKDIFTSNGKQVDGKFNYRFSIFQYGSYCYYFDGRLLFKEKWRHMLKSADKQTDTTLKELYTEAKNVDATLPKYSRSGSFGR